MMNHISLKFIAVCLLMAFGIFFGVEMATKGIETVNGPVTINAQNREALEKKMIREQRTGQQAGQTTSKLAHAQDVDAQAANAKMPKAATPAPVVTETGINHLANKIGGLLQIMAHHGIESVVSLFEKILH